MQAKIEKLHGRFQLLEEAEVTFLAFHLTSLKLLIVKGAT